MRIGLNATCFNNRPSGATQRFKGILGALVTQCRDMEFVIYEPRDCPVTSWFDHAPNVFPRPTPIPSAGRFSRMIKGHFYWRTAFERDRLDLLHNFNLPAVRAPCPSILTLHDVRSSNRLFHEGIMRRAMEQADCVITVSDSMRKELLLIAPMASVKVVYNGVEPRLFEAPSGLDAVSQQLGLPARFLLAVGHLEARKNYARLIDAFALLNDQEIGGSLVIVGNDSGEGRALGAQVRRLGLEGKVCFLHDVSDAELAAIYALSSLVVFPSYYEGFGIPVIEAMAAKRPLACSDIPIFRELTDGHAAYFDPHDSSQMAAEIRALLDNPARQREYTDYGATKLSTFAFSDLARQVEEIYRSLVPGAVA